MRAARLTGDPQSFAAAQDAAYQAAATNTLEFVGFWAPEVYPIPGTGNGRILSVPLNRWNHISRSSAEVVRRLNHSLTRSRSATESRAGGPPSWRLPGSWAESWRGAFGRAGRRRMSTWGSGTGIPQSARSIVRSSKMASGGSSGSAWRLRTRR